MSENKILRSIDRNIFQLKVLGLMQQKLNNGIFTFRYNDQKYAFYLPDVPFDFIQTQILDGNSFFERTMLEKVAQKYGTENMRCGIDIGANIGNHSIFFHKVMGMSQIFAFEPQIHIYSIALKNIQLNECASAIKIEQCCLGTAPGFAQFKRYNSNNFGSCSFNRVDGTNKETKKLYNICTLDDYLQKNINDAIDFIKIDVEGFQMEVLRGAVSTLKQHLPILWIELNTREEYKECITFLSLFGYITREKLNEFNYIFTAR